MKRFICGCLLPVFGPCASPVTALKDRVRRYFVPRWASRENRKW